MVMPYQIHEVLLFHLAGQFIQLLANYGLCMLTDPCSGTSTNLVVLQARPLRACTHTGCVVCTLICMSEVTLYGPAPFVRS